jgi:hypothetical protein
MSAATEKVVKIAAELYKCRDVLVRVHGVAEYRRQIADPVGHLRAISEARGEDILQTALHLAEEAPRDTTRGWIFAAAVESVEPLEVSA